MLLIYLKAGKGAEFFNSVFAAQAFRPDGIVSVDDVMEEAMKPVEWGLSWPWGNPHQCYVWLSKRRVVRFRCRIRMW